MILLQDLNLDSMLRAVLSLNHGGYITSDLSLH